LHHDRSFRRVLPRLGFGVSDPHEESGWLAKGFRNIGGTGDSAGAQYEKAARRNELRQMGDFEQKTMRTRVVRGKPAGREFDIDFWQEQGDDAIFRAAWEMVLMVERF
jgi:hypothetical protein